MKPFTSKHCTPMFYGSPLNQKDEKGDKSPLDIRKSIEAQSRAAREQRAVKGVNQANVKSVFQHHPIAVLRSGIEHR